jgi:hypothetical protein
MAISFDKVIGDSKWIAEQVVNRDTRYDFYQIANEGPNLFGLYLPTLLGHYDTEKAPSIFNLLTRIELSYPYSVSYLAGPIGEAQKLIILRLMTHMRWGISDTFHSLEVIVPNEDGTFTTLHTLDNKTTIRTGSEESKDLKKMPLWYEKILISLMEKDELVEIYSTLHPILELYRFDVTEGKLKGLLPKGYNIVTISRTLESLRDYVFKHMDGKARPGQYLSWLSRLKKIARAASPHIERYKTEIGPLAEDYIKKPKTLDASDLPLDFEAKHLIIQNEVALAKRREEANRKVKEIIGHNLY